MIRRMVEQDIERVLEIQRALGFQTWNYKHFVTEINQPASVPLVMEIGTIMVGYLIVSVAEDVAELLTIAVDPAQQRKGLGYQLLQAGVSDVMLQKCKEVFLEVASNNAPALALYSRLGFQRFGVRKRYYADGQDAILMKMERTIH